MEKQVKNRLYWVNFSLLSLDSGAFSFAVNMFSHLTIVPYYLSRLTDSSTIIGLGPVIFILGMYLPQAFAANFINSLRQRKKYLVAFAVGERVGILLMWLAVFFLATSSSVFSIGVFLMCYGVFTISVGMFLPAHTDLVARSIPVNRGMFYGVSHFMGGMAGIVGTQLASYYLDTFAFPTDFYRIFGLPLLVTGMSLLFWIVIKEPAYHLPIQKRSATVYIKHLKDILVRRTEYRKFVIVRIVLNLCEVATPFFGVYAAIRFDLQPGVFGIFTMVVLVSQGLSTLLWGYIGDRWGFKPVLQIAASFGVAAAALALTAPRYEVFFAVYALIGAMFSAALISNMNLGIEFSEPGETPTYVGLLNSAQAIPLAMAPLLGGVIADIFNYEVTITLGLVLFSIALVYVTFSMTDPRKMAKQSVPDA